MLNKLEATEMWFRRRMERISYTEHVNKCRGPSQSEYNEEADRANGKQADEVFRTRHAQGRDGKLGNYWLCRRQESWGPPEGNLPDVSAKDERKDTNRTDPPDKR